VATVLTIGKRLHYEPTLDDLKASFRYAAKQMAKRKDASFALPDKQPQHLVNLPDVNKVIQSHNAHSISGCARRTVKILLSRVRESMNNSVNRHL
jgi:hypothetical protein